MRHCKHCKKHCCSCVHVFSGLNELFFLTPVPHRPDRSTVHTPPCLCINPVSDLGHTLVVSDTSATSRAKLFCCSPRLTYHFIHAAWFYVGFCAAGSAMFCTKSICILFSWNQKAVYYSPGTFCCCGVIFLLRDPNSTFCISVLLIKVFLLWMINGSSVLKGVLLGTVSRRPGETNLYVWMDGQEIYDRVPPEGQTENAFTCYTEEKIVTQGL